MCLSVSEMSQCKIMWWLFCSELMEFRCKYSLTKTLFFGLGIEIDKPRHVFEPFHTVPQSISKLHQVRAVRCPTDISRMIHINVSVNRCCCNKRSLASWLSVKDWRVVGVSSFLCSRSIVSGTPSESIEYFSSDAAHCVLCIPVQYFIVQWFNTITYVQLMSGKRNISDIKCISLHTERCSAETKQPWFLTNTYHSAIRQ